MLILIISTYYLFEKFVAVPIEAHHKLRCAEVWCALFLCSCALFATHPGKGDILSCHWLDIIAPQYRSALSLQEAANIAGTPPQVCGRSWESIIIPYVCHRNNRANGWSNGCILSLRLCNALSSWRCPLRRFTFQPHRIRTQNTVYLVVKEQNCMTLKSPY